MPFRHELRVRYAEVDQQRIVFNAHYLNFVDEACDMWMRETLGDDHGDWDFDMVLKKAEIVWSGTATWGDKLAIDVAVKRWGNTSFDVGFAGSVGESPVFEAVITYVSITPGTTTPIPIPAGVRAALA